MPEELAERMAACKERLALERRMTPALVDHELQSRAAQKAAKRTDQPQAHRPTSSGHQIRLWHLADQPRAHEKCIK